MNEAKAPYFVLRYSHTLSTSRRSVGRAHVHPRAKGQGSVVRAATLSGQWMSRHEVYSLSRQLPLGVMNAHTVSHTVLGGAGLHVRAATDAGDSSSQGQINRTARRQLLYQPRVIYCLSMASVLSQWQTPAQPVKNIPAAWLCQWKSIAVPSSSTLRGER